jgi:hypothetical protein
MDLIEKDSLHVLLSDDREDFAFEVLRWGAQRGSESEDFTQCGGRKLFLRESRDS